MKKKDIPKYLIALIWFAVVCGTTVHILNQYQYKKYSVDIAGYKVLNLNFTLGDPRAPIAIEVFWNYPCNECKELISAMIDRMLETYIAQKKVQITFRLFPSDKDDILTSVVSYCVATQNQFWRYFEVLYSEPIRMPYTVEEAMNDIEKIPEINRTQFNDCLQDAQPYTYVAADIGLGESRSVLRPPAIFINEKQIHTNIADIIEAVNVALKNEN